MIDETSFTVKAGDGGNGQVSFHKVKKHHKSGPNGGNGGNGGSIYVESTTHVNTLEDLASKKQIFAENGECGRPGTKYAKKIEDIIIRVPAGAMIYNADTGKLIVDLDKPYIKFLLAIGGKGGDGNWNFKSSTNTSPTESTDGEKTEPIDVQLKLKVLAQIGLAGLPNAGKSTLLSVLTEAKPKIGNYPFTTLSPNMGVLKSDDSEDSLVIADIPGLIEGASLGKGLGIQFLKHLQRCQLIVFVLYPQEDTLELSGNDLAQYLWDQQGQIKTEMAQFSPDLVNVSSMIVVNKKDLLSQEQQDAILSFFNTKSKDVMLISAVTNDNIQAFSYELRDNYKKAIISEADGTT